MFPAICFFTSVSLVLALSPNTFTAIFLDSAWLFLTFLSMFWSGLSVGVSCFLLIHVDLLSLSLYDEHRDSLVLDDDDDAGVEYRRRQRSASDHRAPRTCPLQPPRQSSS